MAELKIGVFGAWRGNSYIRLMRAEPRIELMAVCDKNITGKEDDENLRGVALFTDFDHFLAYGKENGMNTVFLANYFHEHAPYAIRAMEAGMDVVSECTAASTLKECVELAEAVERTGRRYMLAENYPFWTANLRMNQIVKSGKLGTLLYAEGEYNHSAGPEDLRRLTPGAYHWRAWMPRTYYVTHAMAPLLYMTNAMPKYVSARAAHSDLLYELRDWRHNYDGVGMMFCEMDNGMIARFTGNTAMASDYTRYRICGDRASVESGGNVADERVRLFYFNHTKPDGEDACQLIEPDPAEFGGQIAHGGHGGGDYRVVQHMIDCLADGGEIFFDVYRAVAMSAVGILGWRSCLNHGENYKIPDFRDPVEREAYRHDDLTPFPDENGEGATLPSALPYEPRA